MWNAGVVELFQSVFLSTSPTALFGANMIGCSVGMMGYCMIQQTTYGIHLRLRARAFIFVDPTTSERVVLVNMDACMTMQSMKTVVVEKLRTFFSSGVGLKRVIR
jgi:hypothetical protein